jgi:cytochrome c
MSHSHKRQIAWSSRQQGSVYVRFSSVSAAAVIGLMVLSGSAAVAQTKPAPKAAPAAKKVALVKPTGDAAAGQKSFEAKCKMCHGGPMAPDLRGVYGRTSGTGTFARYSAGMKSAGIVWQQPTLDTYLQGPAKMVPGTIMAIAPVQQPDRNNIIAYLATLK